MQSSKLKRLDPNVLYLVIRHLRDFTVDMMECFEAGDWNIPSGHIVLYEAGLLLSKDISAVLDKFYITKNKKQLHEDLITAGIAFQHRWQEWLDRSTLETFRYYPASKLFHEQLLRWYKGAIKTYRIWLIDLAK